MDTFWAVIKAIAVLIPYLIQIAQEGRVRMESQTELADAIKAKVSEHVAAAERARNDARSGNGRMPDDPLDRSRGG